MATGVDCCCESTYTVPTNIPGTTGATGAAGADGTDGVNAFTTTTANSNVPAAVGSNVTLAVADSTWAVVGQVVAVTGPSHYRVVSKPSDVALELSWLDYPNDVAAGAAIASGSQISPAGELSPGFAAAGSPEGAQVASPGATYLNTTDDSFWVKKTGSNTNTGWIAIVTAWVLFCGLIVSYAAPPVVRQQFTTNSQANVVALATNLARSVITNDAQSLAFQTNVIKAVSTNEADVLLQATNRITAVVTNTLALYTTITNAIRSSNQFNGIFVGNGISITNTKVLVGSNATATSANLSIYLTNQNGQVFRVAAEGL